MPADLIAFDCPCSPCNAARERQGWPTVPPRPIGDLVGAYPTIARPSGAASNVLVNAGTYTSPAFDAPFAMVDGAGRVTLETREGMRRRLGREPRLASDELLPPAPRGRTLLDAQEPAVGCSEQLQRRTGERDFLDRAVQKAGVRVMELERALEDERVRASNGWEYAARTEERATTQIAGLEGTIANQATLISEQHAMIMNRDEKLVEMVGLCDEQAAVIGELRRLLDDTCDRLAASQWAATTAKWNERVAESANDALAGIVEGLQQRLAELESVAVQQERRDVGLAEPEAHQDMWPALPPRANGEPAPTVVRFVFVEVTGDPADLGIEDAAELLVMAAERAG